MRLHPDSSGYLRNLTFINMASPPEPPRSSARLADASGRSSASSSISVEHLRSPVESPDGDSYQGLPLKLSDSMEFQYFDEDDGEGSPCEQKLSKRDIHTLNEQRRRDLIKIGYEQLTELVPTCRPTSGGVKPSRAVILQRSIDYILFLHGQGVKQEDQVEDLQKEVQALRIMKENYEHISKAHQSASSPSTEQVQDSVKFMVFQGIADQLFQSFNSSISVTSFDTLSSCIISWLEEYCKPQTLREIVLANLRQVDSMRFTGSTSSTTTQLHPSETFSSLGTS